MKKKLLTILLMLTLSANFIACGNSEPESGTNAETSKNHTEESSEINKDSEPESPNPEKEQSNAQSDVDDKDSPTEESEDLAANLSALGDVDVDGGIFNVKLTIPAEYVGESTQEQLDEQATEYGYKVTKNDDGTATYTMTKSQHKKILKDLADSINDSFSEYINTEDYPNITNIEANKNFTNFTVTTKSTELDMAESFLPMAFYIQGGMYSAFSGENISNVHVDFVNADTGEIISSSDSSDTE